MPTGVSSVAIDAIGAGGAAGSAAGGLGGEVSGTVAVTHGQVLEVCVNLGGAPGGPSGGGAGGGASGVSVGSNFGSPVVVAGGGGGGAAGTAAAGGGGSAGPSGGGGFASTASGPGSGVAGTGFGGGGGGGSVGGSGGSGGAIGASGGAGGTNLCNASGCSTTTVSNAPQVTLAYTVASSPTVSITTPANGAIYGVDQAVTTGFACTEGANGPGISSCADQNGRGSGASLDTSTLGTHTFTVTSQSQDGLGSSSSVTYSVAAAPRIYLPLPSNGATYVLGQAVHSYFLCADGPGGPGLRSCVDQNGQPSGTAIDTSTLGSHTFTVTATSDDGQVGTTTVTYRVVPAPAVAHVVAHRGGIVTLQVTLSTPGAVDVMNTAGFKSFALAADVVQPPKGSFVFGRAHVFSSRSQTLTLRVGLSQAGKLLLRDHRKATVSVWVLYTPAGGLTADLVKTLMLSVRR